MADETKSWLEGLGLGQYAGAFAENDIDFNVLAELDDGDLKELGISLGHRRRLLKAIRQLHPATVDESLGSAERRQLTVMFCDLVGSTQLSVRMDPEELREVISRFQKACEQTVQAFGGNVARYMGDGLLVYFGYPAADERDPESAIHAGLEIIKAVNRLIVGNRTMLQTRIGIATGQVVVGDLIGAGSARERSVIGETPNLAARLQTMANPDEVVISEATRRLVEGLFELTPLGEHLLRGFDLPVTVWRVGKPIAIESRFEALRSLHHLTPLVSRENEIQRLMEYWVAARAGHGQGVLISGEPGIGKSRLVHTLRERLAAVPHNTLRYFCAAHFQNTALYPVMRNLKAAAGIETEAPPDTKLDKLEAFIEQTHGDVAIVAPFLAELLSLPAGGRYRPIQLSPQMWMERTLEILHEQLVRLSRDHPVLAIIEDLHWVDPTTLELLKRTVRRLERVPILLVMTARPGFASPWDRESIHQIELERLPRNQSALLAASATHGKSLPEEVVDRIVEKSDGIPLFIEELVRALVDSGLLVATNGAYTLSRPLSDTTLPDSLQDLLMARLDSLAEAKEIAQIGAAIGRQFNHRLLSVISHLPAEQLSEAAARLVASGLVSCSDEPPETVYTFKHALIQDSAYSSLLKKKRRQLHRRIAHALESELESVAAVQPETLAHHYTRAGDDDTAIRYWYRAALLATRHAAHADAIEHINKALELLPSMPDDELRKKREIDLQVTLGRNQEATLGYVAPEVERTFGRARDLCLELGVTTEQVPVLLGLCVYHLVRAEHELAREFAEKCVELSRQAGNRGYLIESFAILAFPLYYLGELQESHTVAAQCLSLYEASAGDSFEPVTAQDPCVSVLYQDAITLWQLGFPDTSIRVLEKAIALAEKLAQPINFAEIYAHATILYKLRGDLELALKYAQLAIDVSAEHGYSHWQRLGRLHYGLASGVLSDAAEGLEIIGGALETLRAAGAQINFTYFLGGIAEVHLAAGDAAAGLEYVRQALEQAGRNTERGHIVYLHILRGDCHLALPHPDPAAAEADFEQAIQLAKEQDARMVELRATCRLFRLRRRLGTEALMRQALGALLDTFIEGFETKDFLEARSLLQA